MAHNLPQPTEYATESFEAPMQRDKATPVFFSIQYSNIQSHGMFHWQILQSNGVISETLQNPNVSSQLCSTRCVKQAPHVSEYF